MSNKRAVYLLVTKLQRGVLLSQVYWLFIELLINEVQLSPLPTPHDEEGCHAPHQRSGRIDSKRSAKSLPQENSHRKDKLLPSFYITILIHEIRKQQRSEERYVRGASHWSVSPKRLHPLFDTFPPPAFYHPRNRQYYHVLTFG